MDRTFLDLAHSLHQASAIGVEIVARMAGNAPADAVQKVIERERDIALAAELLADLAPQETLVRSLIDVGALAAFPAYSPNTSDVRVGNMVLMRGQVAGVFPGECQVAFAANRVATSFLIARRDLVGIERSAPTLWRPPER